MVETDHPGLSVTRQCELVAISRSSFYYAAKGEDPLNLALMRLIVFRRAKLTPSEG